MESLNLFCACLCIPCGLWAWGAIIGRALRGREIHLASVPVAGAVVLPDVPADRATTVWMKCGE